jgi:hypothetical protein
VFFMPHTFRSQARRARDPGRPRRDDTPISSLSIIGVGALALLVGSVRALDARLISSDTRDLARFLHDKIRMTDAEIATAADVRSQTVRRWRSTAATSSPRNTERLDDLRAIVALLLQSGVLYAEEIGRWLRARSIDLGYARPYVLIGQGKFDAVRHAAEAHVARLEGRRLDPNGSGTLDNEIEHFFAALPTSESDQSTSECVGHGIDPRA